MWATCMSYKANLQSLQQRAGWPPASGGGRRHCAGLACTHKLPALPAAVAIKRLAGTRRGCHRLAAITDQDCAARQIHSCYR